MAEKDLEKFIESVSGDDYLTVEEDLGCGFVRLRTAEAERRQAKHDIRSVEDIVIEMLRNARDAHATHIYLATTRDGDVRRLAFIDDGDGIPESLHETIFEPRVTSKLQSMVMDKWGVHGRGMALYAIRSNARLARVASSGPGLGTSIEVVADLSSIPERKDQSTFPDLVRDDQGEQALGSGPHNMLRAAADFSIESRESPLVYFGSPAEIAARLVEDGSRELTDDQLLFCDDVEELPVCCRPAGAGDAAELVSICKSIGLSISERTAHRIMARQIEPCTSIRSRLARNHTHATARKPDLYHDGRGLKLSSDDLKRFSQALESAFAPLASSYYLSLSEPPKIRVSGDSVNVKFNIRKEL